MAPELPSGPLLGLEYAVVDVETTGGSFARGDRVLEVAVVCVRGDGRVMREFTSLVDPGRLIPPFNTRLTGISAALVSGAPQFGEISGVVHRLLARRVLVAHNIRFDWSFLRGEFGLEPGSVHAGGMLCTLRLARRLVPELPSRSLGHLVACFGLENEARHRALGDTRATVALLQVLLGRAAASQVEDWEGLQRLLAGRARARRAAAQSSPPCEE